MKLTRNQNIWKDAGHGLLIKSSLKEIIELAKDAYNEHMSPSEAEEELKKLCSKEQVLVINAFGREGYLGFDYIHQAIEHILKSDSYEALGRATKNAINKASNAFLIKSQVKSEQFKQWFGTSKVVGTEGMPVVVFHGSDNDYIKSFLTSHRGTVGSGIYFCNTEKSALDYGEHLYEVYLSIQNPWVISLDYESKKACEIDFDSPSVEAILSLADGSVKVEESKSTDGLYGNDISMILSNMGYDGIVGTYPDGSMEYVVFSANQVKSSVKNNGEFSLKSTNIYQ